MSGISYGLFRKRKMRTIVESILSHAKFDPNRVALITSEGKYTYSDLKNGIIECEGKLREHNVVQSDNIIISADHTFGFISMYFGIHHIGAVAVPINPNTTELQMEKYIDYIEPRVLVSGNRLITMDFSNRISAHTYEPDILDRLADIVFTSGTTGEPKGVMLTHRNLAAGCENVINGGSLCTEDVALVPAPLYHAFGLASMRSVLYCGATLVLQDGLSSLRTTYANLYQNDVTQLYITPSALTILINQCAGDIGKLLRKTRKIELCSAPLKPQMRMKLMEELPDTTLIYSYGTTEASRSSYLCVDTSFHGLNSVGHDSPNSIIEIVDEQTGRTIDVPDTFGTLVIKGNVVSPGYYKYDTEELKDCIYHTRDSGYRDSNGYLYIMGRLDDMINKGGEKVFPNEIESVVMSFDSVKDCACIGVKQEESPLDESIVLFVVGNSDDKKNLDMYLRSQLDKYKIPDKIFFLKAIPKTSAEKTDRNELRKIYAELNPDH